MCDVLLIKRLSASYESGQISRTQPHSRNFYSSFDQRRRFRTYSINITAKTAFRFAINNLGLGL